MQNFSEIFHKFRKYRINPNKIGKLGKKMKKNSNMFRKIQKKSDKLRNSYE